jgi:hypothetical protein
MWKPLWQWKFDRKKQDTRTRTRTQNRGFCTLRSFTHFHNHLTISLIFSQHLCTDLHPYFCFTQFHTYLRIFLIFLTTTLCTFLPTYASHAPQPLRLQNEFRSKWKNWMNKWCVDQQQATTSMCTTHPKKNKTKQKRKNLNIRVNKRWVNKRDKWSI